MNLMKHGETYVLTVTSAELDCVHTAIVLATSAAPVQPAPGEYGRGWFVQMDDDLVRLRRNLIPGTQR